ncbi:hypothetical protein CXF85_13225 [Colwellia sp. 75C3]|uniref:hypothetical protein n=1 Tax=Colwellia sp. 75C3 TaxID=888425 RepID=UPI000C340E26|nr:hypothetical protein [Colwellia sp. 75C3]PKG82445.1 hypothetical protein CXF85_13225 [Colwellia sp. 75C3]
MNMSGLSFNALPPIDLPFRFFLTAPLFIIACALLVLFSGETLWLSRWQPNMLALTHGFTLGFLTMVMMGALLQLLPVIGGVGIAKPRFIATTSHVLYCAGVVALMFSFVFAHQWLTLAALILLSLGFGLYLSAIIGVLIKKISQGDSINGFRLAIISLVILLLLGVLLLANRVGISVSFITLDKHLTDIHALMGLVGWAGLLIIAVSFQVIPMFHVAPSMPKYIKQYLAGSIFILLMLYIFYAEFALALIFISHGVFAVTLFYVIKQRKRKVPDTSIKYWQLAAATLLLLNVLYFLPEYFYHSEETPLFMPLPDKGMLLTAIFIYFYLLSVIQGMLLKILPFLSYTHLQQRCLIDFSAMQFIPHMHDFLNKKQGVALYYMHIISGLSLVAVIFEPSLYVVFALFLLIEFVWLLFLMLRCMRLYFSVSKKINLSNNT